MHIVINCIILLDMFQSLLKSIVGYAFVVYLLEGLLDLLLDSEEFIQICSILNLDGWVVHGFYGLFLPIF